MAVTMQYKPGRSIVHRMNTGLKLGIFLALAILSMIAPVPAVLAAAFLCAVFAWFCGWTFAELVSDLKPAFYYAFLLVSAGAVSVLYIMIGQRSFSGWNFLQRTIAVVNIGYMLRLLFIMLSSALLFRTTSSIALKDTLYALETRIRVLLVRLPFVGAHIAREARLSIMIALTLSFIPQIFSLWHNLDRAWRARGGVSGIRKTRLLLFVLFSLSFHAAAQKAKALAAREVF